MKKVPSSRPTRPLFLGVEVFPIGFDIVYTRPDGHKAHKGDRSPRKRNYIGTPIRIEYKTSYPLENRLDKYGTNSDYLRDGLYLTEVIRGNNDITSRRNDKSHRGDRKFTENNDDKCEYHKRAEIFEFIKDNEHRAYYHEFISNGVYKFAEIGNQIILSCYLSIKHIGYRGNYKEYNANYTRSIKMYRQHTYEQ